MVVPDCICEAKDPDDDDDSDALLHREVRLATGLKNKRVVKRVYQEI